MDLAARSDPELVRMFLMVHRRFMRSSDLLDQLVDAFDSSPAMHPTRLRVCNLILHWAAHHWEDFHTEKMRFTLRLLLAVCRTTPGCEAIANSMAALIDRPPLPEESHWGHSDCTGEDCILIGCCPGVTAGPSSSISSTQSLSTSLTASLQSSPSSSVTAAPQCPKGSSALASSTSPTTTTTTTKDFLAIDTNSIVQQLNSIEAELFGKIKPRDLLQHIWNRRYESAHAMSVADSVGHFNYISSWVVSKIVSEPKTRLRADLIIKFMMIAQELRETNNYNTLMAVLSAIGSAPVQRLRKTQRLVMSSPLVPAGHDVLESLMSSERSFSGYRQALKRSDAPCIPYLGVVLRDLLYVDEANKDHRSDGSVNIAKFLLMADIIAMMQSFQSSCHLKVPRDTEILKHILDQPTLSESGAFDRSLEVEPRAVRP